MLVALLSEKADVQYVAERISPDRIVAEIEGLGFGAQLISESDVYQEGTIDLSVGIVHLLLTSFYKNACLCFLITSPLPFGEREEEVNGRETIYPICIIYVTCQYFICLSCEHSSYYFCYVQRDIVWFHPKLS